MAAPDRRLLEPERATIETAGFGKARVFGIALCADLVDRPHARLGRLIERVKRLTSVPRPISRTVFPSEKAMSS
jgi:hypothetical protein